MKLKEYFAAVARVLHEHRTEGEIFDAIIEGKTEEGQPGIVLKEFDRAIAEVRAALIDNKKLLGVFDDDAENPEPAEKKREREIDEKAMRRHLLKVRRDLSRFAPETSGDPEKVDKISRFEWIVVKIMTDICGKLGSFPELGGIFSKTEAMAYRREFAAKPSNPATSPAVRTASSIPATSPMPADLSAPASSAKPSPTLEELTQRAIAARTKSYEEQKAAIDALNEELRRQKKIL